jgi:adenylate/guanylate cyclase family protein
MVIGTLTEKWRRLGHDIGFGIGIAHGFATLGTIGFEGRFDYAAIGTVANVASRLCDEAKPSRILISLRVLMAVEEAVTVEPVGEFALKGIRRPLAAYNVLGTISGVRPSRYVAETWLVVLFTARLLCCEVGGRSVSSGPRESAMRGSARLCAEFAAIVGGVILTSGCGFLPASGPNAAVASSDATLRGPPMNQPETRKPADEARQALNVLRASASNALSAVAASLDRGTLAQDMIEAARQAVAAVINQCPS